MQKKHITSIFTICLTAAVAVTSFPCGALAETSASQIGMAGIAAATATDTTGAVKATGAIEAPLTSTSKLANIALKLGKGEPVSEKKAEETDPAAISAMESRLESKANSLYNNLAISKISDGYVNIRSKASTDGKVVGKIYNNAAATIVDTISTKDGNWYKIKSGTVEGYISAKYFVTGDEAEKLALKVGYVTATINTEALRLREKADLGSGTLTVLARDEAYEVEEVGTEFTKISIDGELEGYVSNNYIEVSVDYAEAISLEEEKKQQEEEAKRKAEAEAAAKKLAEEESKEQACIEKASKEKASKEAASKAAAKKSTKSTSSKKSTTEETKKKSSKSTKKTTEETTKKKSSSKSSSSKREAIVAEAKKYYGKLNYVLGGDSLETGTDCSGFIQQIYMKFGIYLPRVSTEQGNTGKAVSSDEMKPGDIVYYKPRNGMGHVAIYIGDGEVIHCSSPTSNPNTRISTWNYRSVVSIRNVID